MKRQKSHKSNAGSGQSKKPGSGFIWAKALVAPVLIMVIIGSFAILSGRNKPRPIDWVYVNAITEKKNLVLPDGSRVILRKGSSIAYPSDFGKTTRYVQLLGEALFHVQKYSTIPFAVRTKNEITASTGTSFIVRSNESKEVVIVSSGQVRLETSSVNGEFITLNPGQKAEIVNNKVQLSAVNITNTFAWTNEQLVFNRATLRQVADDIYNLYGVPIHFSSDIHTDDILVTAQFNNQSLKNIIDNIASRTTLVINYSHDSILVTLPEEIKAGNPEMNAAEKKKRNLFQKVFSKK